MEIILKTQMKLEEMTNPMVSELATQITADSWFGLVREEEANKLLAGKKIGTYLFRESADGSIFLSGINDQGAVSHNRFLKNDLVWLALNTGPYLRKSAAELISLCLHCVDAECSPLKA